MSRFLLILGVFLALPLTARAAASTVGLLPEERISIETTPDERNPFGRKGPRTPKIEDTENEETRIRGILTQLAISGVQEKGGDYRALLGSFVAKPGGELPPVMEKQTEKVRVITISAESVELAFVDKDGTAALRKLILPIRIKPEVRFDLDLRTGPPESASGEATLGGVLKPHATEPVEK